MKRLFRSKIAWGIALATATALGVFGYHQANAGMITDCTNNSIIKCGVASSSALANKVKANNPRDLQAIYKYFGLSAADYDKFGGQAVAGIAKRDGTIVVNGQVVAKDTWSIGRTGFSYSSPITIAGHKYYKSMDTRVLKQDLPVMVLFNSQGVMQFAAMNACGNPATGNKVVPKYSCDLLQKTPVAGKANTYAFKTKATYTNNALFAKAVYDFGDGSTYTSTHLAESVNHTYQKPGTYTAKVTVYFKLPGNHNAYVSGANCQTQITVQAPPQVSYTCDELQALPAKDDELSYTFEANTSSQNAKLTGADFDFGDGTNAPNVAPASANQVSVDHTYKKPGDYSVQATVHFEITDEKGQKSVKSVNCQVQINSKVCSTNPNLPPNSPECQPCKYDHKLPADSKKCVKPVKQLVNTGPGDILGLFAGASLVGFLGYRFYLSRRFLRG